MRTSHDCLFCPLGAFIPHKAISCITSRETGSFLYLRMLRRDMMFSITAFPSAFSLQSQVHSTAVHSPVSALHPLPHEADRSPPLPHDTAANKERPQTILLRYLIISLLQLHCEYNKLPHQNTKKLDYFLLKITARIQYSTLTTMATYSFLRVCSHYKLNET